MAAARLMFEVQLAGLQINRSTNETSQSRRVGVAGT